MRKVIFLFLTFTMILVATIKAQNVVGTVVDESNGSSIPGATVYLKSTNYGTVTDINGGFKLKAKGGDFKLVVSSVGFKTFEKDVNIEQGQDLDLGTIELKVDAIGIEEIKIMASFAQDRKTPVAISTIEPTVITEKLGAQEFPEILKTTPSVYATKSGGGFGDSRINIRGFSSENVGVLINGMPINDMEGGTVYWSNWAGLSDVTRTMQVQRGLGAAKVALSSVGGTINIITKTTDADRGGNLTYMIGNNGLSKMGFTVSTGMYDNGWAVTVSGSHSTGDGYVRGTNFEAWSYFFNVAKQFSNKNQLSFTMLGAPQWHNQRYYRHYIEDYRTNPYGRQWNPDYGYMNGQIYSTEYNYYDKPVAMLTHFYKFNDKWSLNSVLYGSWGRGGGRRVLGASASDPHMLQLDSYGEPYDNSAITVDGLFDWSAVQSYNQSSLTGSKVILANATNSHDWYGILSTLNGKVGKIDLTAGIDARYYIGYHDESIDDLLGGKYFLNTANLNRDPNTPLYKGDNVAYDYQGVVQWQGLFAQAEYSSTNFTAFLSLAGSHTVYQRIDFFQYTPETKYVSLGDTVTGQKSLPVSFISYSIKGGINYNISDNFNVFVNAGYFTRPPYMKFVFQNNTNVVIDSIQLEKIMTFEGGLGYKSKYFSANVYGYYTNWLNKTMTVTLGNTYADIPGLNALHKGLEFTAQFRPIAKMQVGLMASLGDWRWQNNVEASLYDINTQQFIGNVHVYAKGLHVSDAAQTTAAITWDYEILPKLKVGMDWTYYDRMYAKFTVENRTSATDTADAWRMPSYNLLDFNARYNFNIGNMDATLIGNVDNVLNTEYISDGTDGTKHDATTALVYYGFGRTWSLTLRIKF